MTKPRIGIVVTELGIPSEVWILRQCQDFTQIEPVILCWKIREGFTPPAGLEVRQFAMSFEDRPSLWRRAARRLGMRWAALPNAARRRDIAATVAAARLDGILCHFAWSGLAISAALKGSLPIVWQVHGRDVSAKLREPAYRGAVARALPGVDHLVAVGKFQIGLLEPLGLGPNRSVIPCGAPLALFAANPAPRRAPGQALRFISVGRISAEKGVLQTLDAFEQVAARQPDVELVFIGDGPLKEALAEAVAKSPAADRIRLLGVAPPAAVAAELSAAHVFLQHSRCVNGWVEGFGVALTEAGASGLPLVASRLGGILDQVVHEENGLLFDVDDVETQAEHMLRLANDEPLRRAMGETARTTAARFDSGLMTRQLESVLTAVVGRRS